MAEKKLKKEHFEILLEEIKGNVKLVLEGHQILNKKIDETQALVKEVERNLSHKIDGVKTALDYHIQLPVH